MSCGGYPEVVEAPSEEAFVEEVTSVESMAFITQDMSPRHTQSGFPRGTKGGPPSAMHSMATYAPRKEQDASRGMMYLMKL